MAQSCPERVAESVVQYYEWLSDNGGIDPETLLSQPLSIEERRELLDRMNDINCIWGITAPLRNAREGGDVSNAGRSREERNSA